MGAWPVLPFLGLGLAVLAFPVLLLGLLGATLTLWSRVRRLDARLRTLEGLAGRLTPASAESREPAAASPPVAASPPAAAAPPVAGSSPAVASPVVAPGAALPSPPITAPASPPAVSPHWEEARAIGTPRQADAPAPAAGGPGADIGALEGRVGGTWLNRVGALVLVLGIGLFLRHAFESDWIGPGGRVGLGGLVGLAFVLSAARHLEGEYRGVAQGAVAVGLASLYLSAYAAHSVYGLLPTAPALVALALVTALTLVMAVRHAALALALLAGAGGLLTPVLLDTGTDPGGLLFAYLGVLDVGLLAAAHRRRWWSLRLLAFVGTAVLYAGWLDRWFGPGRLALGLLAATGLYLLFAGAAYLGTPGRNDAGDLDPGFTAAALLGLAAPTLYFLALRHLVVGEPRSTLPLACLGLALGYVLAGQWALRERHGNQPLGALCLSLALGFVSIALALRLSRHALVVGWGVEALLLYLCGHRLELRRLRAGAVLVFVVTWGRWYTLLSDGGLPGPFLLSHPALPATAAVAVTAALAASIGAARQRAGRRQAGWERVVPPIMVLVAVGSVAALLSDELARFRTLAIPPPYVPTVTTVVWMVAALPWLALARLDKTRILVGVVTLLFIVLGATVVGDAPRWEQLLPDMRAPLLNPRFLAALLLVVLYGLYARVVRGLPTLSEPTRGRLSATAGLAAGLLLLWNLSVEVSIAPLPALTLGEAVKARRAGLSILWALYAFGAMGLGLRTGRRAVRLGAIGLFAVTVVKVLGVDLAGLDAPYRVLSLVVLGGVLLLASFLYARTRRSKSA